MLSTSLTIPAAELPLVEASLDECPGLRLIGVDHFSRSYCDVHLDYTTPSDLDQLGSCVGRALEAADQPHD